jgi:hypothetical protein
VVNGEIYVYPFDLTNHLSTIGQLTRSAQGGVSRPPYANNLKSLIRGVLPKQRNSVDDKIIHATIAKAAWPRIKTMISPSGGAGWFHLSRKGGPEPAKPAQAENSLKQKNDLTRRANQCLKGRLLEFRRRCSCPGLISNIRISSKLPGATVTSGETTVPCSARSSICAHSVQRGVDHSTGSA